jgi:hypothetical protein
MSGPQLRDIILPPDPGFWPPAPGWWLVALSAVLAIVWLVRRAIGALQRRRRRRRLLAELNAVLAESNEPQQRLAAMSCLLRRWSKLHSASDASRTGEAWLAALDRDLPDAPFSGGAGRMLLVGPYLPQPPAEGLEDLEVLVRRRILQEPTRA